MQFGYAAPFCFRVILEKPQGGGGQNAPPPHQGEGRLKLHHCMELPQCYCNALMVFRGRKGKKKTAWVAKRIEPGLKRDKVFDITFHNSGKSNNNPKYFLKTYDFQHFAL